ncbi:hypothetical protein Dimus_010548 [Dionaea muscipula]
MEEVTELQPVSDAHVPVMKFKFQGVSIDLLYASVSLLVVPNECSPVVAYVKEEDDGGFWSHEHVDGLFLHGY